MTTANLSTPTGESRTKLDPQILRTASVVVLGGVMSILDTTIVNVAINDLSGKFGAPLALIQWVATGYMLALATAIPLTGWGADRFGTKRLYITSILLFVAGSILSGAAWSASSLIVFRILQGLGGGMIVPTGMTILTHEAGPQRIGRVMGIVGVPMLLGPVLGPILGGYLVDQFSWRWIFFVNIPIGALAVVAALRILKTDEPKPHHLLDWKGLLLLSPGLGIFVYGLAELASGRSISSATTVGSVGLGLMLLVAFILRSKQRDDALIDVKLFARRTVAASALTNFFFGSVFFSLSLLMPLYIQIVRGQPAFQAGLLLAVQGIGAMITMPIAGKLTDKIGAGKVVMCGVAVFALGIFSLTRLTGDTPFRYIQLALFLNGLGAGATMMPTMSAALGTLKRGEVARGASGLNVLLRAGGSVGTALAVVLLTAQLSNVVGSAGNVPFDLAAARSLPAAARAAMLPALGGAFGNTFLGLFGIVLLTFISAMFLPRKPKAGVAQ